MRRCIFIDNSNLFHGLKSKNLRFDYSKLIKFLSGKYSSDVRFYFSETESDSRNGFYKFLEFGMKCLMVSLPLRFRTHQDQSVLNLINSLQSKGCSDNDILRIANQNEMWLQQIRGEKDYIEEKGLGCEIVYDMAVLSRAGNYDEFILVAGDEDYVRTVERLRREIGFVVKVAFFESLCSCKLQNACSSLINFDENLSLLCEEK